MKDLSIAIFLFWVYSAVKRRLAVFIQIVKMEISHNFHH